MKTLKLIGMAFMAMTLSLSVSSCDDEDDDNNSSSQVETSEDGIVVGEKKLVEVKKIEDDGSSHTSTISYDSEGRLSSIVRKSLDNTSRLSTYEWGNGTITEHRTEYGETTTSTYSLSGNLVTKSEGDRMIENYTYNKSNRVATYEWKEITTYSDDYSEYITYTWDGDKLINYIVHGTDNSTSSHRIYSFSYSGKTCNGYFPIDDWVGLETLHPELFGSRTNQLPDSMTIEEDGGYVETFVYSYTFDDDGYVTSRTEVYTWPIGSYSDSGEETYVYYYTWE